MNAPWFYPMGNEQRNPPDDMLDKLLRLKYHEAMMKTFDPPPKKEEPKKPNDKNKFLWWYTALLLSFPFVTTIFNFIQLSMQIQYLRALQSLFK